MIEDIDNMGTWGSGNFENDAANDYLGKILSRLVKEISENLSTQKLNHGSFLENYGEYQVIPTIDIFITLSEVYDAPPTIDIEQAKEWRRLYLQAFDKADYMYSGNFKIERRFVIEKTFDRLEKILISWDDN